MPAASLRDSTPTISEQWFRKNAPPHSEAARRWTLLEAQNMQSRSGLPKPGKKMRQIFVCENGDVLLLCLFDSIVSPDNLYSLSAYTLSLFFLPSKIFVSNLIWLSVFLFPKSKWSPSEIRFYSSSLALFFFSHRTKRKWRSQRNNKTQKRKREI